MKLVRLVRLAVNQLVVDGKFELIEQFSFDCEQPFTHEVRSATLLSLPASLLSLVILVCCVPFCAQSWRGRMRTCNGVGSGVLTEDQVNIVCALG